jgi:hypothetical protein
MDTNGWSDTGQQFTVTRDGIILEGRHGSIGAILNRVNVLGAQCAGFNSESGGTEHEGEYDEEHMPLPQWNASVDLHSWIVDRTGIDSTDIDGHRDHVSTDCPGAWLYSQLPKFRQAVHSKLAVWRKANP